MADKLTVPLSLAGLLPLRDATMDARSRTGDDTLSTRVSKGLVQVVSVVYPKGGRGRSEVTPLSEYMTIPQATEFLDNMVAKSEEPCCPDCDTTLDENWYCHSCRESWT